VLLAKIDAAIASKSSALACTSGSKTWISVPPEEARRPSVGMPAARAANRGAQFNGAVDENLRSNFNNPFTGSRSARGSPVVSGKPVDR
jgi:hypothetical protein